MLAGQDETAIANARTGLVFVVSCAGDKCVRRGQENIFLNILCEAASFLVGEVAYTLCRDESSHSTWLFHRAYVAILAKQPLFSL
jgi:hypothetical protein